MKSFTVVGLGLIAFMTGAVLAPHLVSENSAGAAGRRTGGSFFRAQVDGDYSDRPTGKVAFGAIGLPGEAGATFTITLGAEGSAGAIVFTRLDGVAPRPGRYPIGNSAALDRAGGFRALYVAGSASRPRGVFHGEAGTIEITSAARDHVSGHFELTARGFLAEFSDDEHRRVTVSGAFTSRLTP